MAKVKFDDGTVINFEGTPSPKDIEEAYNSVKGIPNVPQKSQLSQVTPEQYGMVGRAITNPLNIPNFPGTENIVNRFQQGMGRGIGAGINAALYNMPNALMRKLGVNILPPATTPEQKVGELAGTIGGGIVSPITRAGMAIGRVPQAARLLTKVGRGALGGAAMGGAYTPDNDIIAGGERARNAMIGSAIGAVLPTVVALKRYLTPKVQVGIKDEAVNSLTNIKQGLIEKYGKYYDKYVKSSQGKISLQEPLSNLINESDDVINSIKGHQELSEALAKGDTTAKKVLTIVDNFMNNKNVPQQVSLQEADTIQKYIKGLPSIRNKIARGQKIGFDKIDWNNSERILLNFANDLKSQVLSQAPEMSIINKEYGQFMTNFKRVREYLKWDSGVNNFKNLHRLDPNIKITMEQTLPKNVMNKILNVNRVERANTILKWITGAAVTGTAAGAAGRMAFRH